MYVMSFTSLITVVTGLWPGTKTSVKVVSESVELQSSSSESDYSSSAAKRVCYRKVKVQNSSL